MRTDDYGVGEKQGPFTNPTVSGAAVAVSADLNALSLPDKVHVLDQLCLAMTREVPTTMMLRALNALVNVTQSLKRELLTRVQ